MRELSITDAVVIARDARAEDIQKLLVWNRLAS